MNQSDGESDVSAGANKNDAPDIPRPSRDRSRGDRDSMRGGHNQNRHGRNDWRYAKRQKMASRYRSISRNSQRHEYANNNNRQQQQGINNNNRNTNGGYNTMPQYDHRASNNGQSTSAGVQRGGMRHGGGGGQSQGGGNAANSGRSSGRDAQNSSGAGRASGPDRGRGRGRPVNKRSYNVGRGIEHQNEEATPFSDLPVDTTKEQGRMFYKGVTVNNGTLDMRRAQVARTDLGLTLEEVIEKTPRRYMALGEGGVTADIPQRNGRITQGGLMMSYTDSVLSLAAGEEWRDSGDQSVRMEPSVAAEYLLSARLDPGRVFAEGGPKLPNKEAFIARRDLGDLTAMAKSYLDRYKSPGPLVKLADRTFGNEAVWEKSHKDFGGKLDQGGPYFLKWSGTFPAAHGYVIPSVTTDQFMFSANPPMPLPLTEDSAFEFVKLVARTDNTGMMNRYDVRTNAPSTLLKNQVAMQQRQRQNVCFKLATTYRPLTLSTTDRACLMTFFETMHRNPGSGLNELISRCSVRVFNVVTAVLEHVMEALGRRGLLATTELPTTNPDMAADPLVSYDAIKAYYERESLTQEMLDLKINVGPMTEVNVPGATIKLYHMKVGNKMTVRQEKEMYRKSPDVMVKDDEPCLLAYEAYTGGLPNAAFGAEMLSWDMLVDDKNALKPSNVMQRVCAHFDRNVEFPFDGNHTVVFAAFASTMEAMVHGALDDHLRTGTAAYVPPLLWDPSLASEFVDVRQAEDMALAHCKFSIMQLVYLRQCSLATFRALLQWVICMMQVRGGLDVEYTKLRVYHTMKEMRGKSYAERVKIVHETALCMDTNGEGVSYNRWCADLNARTGSKGPTFPTVDYVPPDVLKQVMRKSEQALKANVPVVLPKRQNNAPHTQLRAKLADWQEVSINEDTLKHKVPPGDVFEWMMQRKISLNVKVTEGVKETFMAFDSKIQDNQAGLESAIRKTSRMFSVDDKLTVKVVKETLEKYGNKDELLKYVWGEKVYLPLLKQDTVWGNEEPSPQRVLRWAKTSVFAGGMPKGDFSLMTTEQVIIEFILSLCPNVVNTNLEQFSFKGPLSVLGAYCAMLLPKMDTHLYVVAGANIALYCGACMHSLFIKKGTPEDRLDPRFGLVSVSNELGETKDNVSQYQGMVIEPNSTEAGLLFMRLPLYHPIRRALMTVDDTQEGDPSALVGMLWLMGVRGYNITGAQRCAEFVRGFVNTAHKIRQAVVEVTGDTDKNVCYDDVVLGMSELHNQMRLVGIHSQYQSMYGQLMHGGNWDSAIKMITAVGLIIGGEVQYTNERKWGVVQSAAATQLKRPTNSEGNEIDAQGEDRQNEVAMFQGTNELANSYKGDLPSEVKRGCDTIMALLTNTPMPNAITLNRLALDLAGLRLRDQNTSQYIAAMVTTVKSVYKLSNTTCAAYETRRKDKMPKKNKHEMFAGGTAKRWEERRFARLVAAAAPVLEFAVCISPESSVNHIAMKLFLANVGMMVTGGLDVELKVALSHTAKWGPQFYQGETAYDTIGDVWPEFGWYGDLPEMVLFLESDTEARKKEVKDWCTAKMHPTVDPNAMHEDSGDSDPSESESEGGEKQCKDKREKAVASIVAGLSEMHASSVQNTNKTAHAVNSVPATDGTAVMDAERSNDPLSDAAMISLNTRMESLPHAPPDTELTDTDGTLPSVETGTSTSSTVVAQGLSTGTIITTAQAMAPLYPGQDAEQQKQQTLSTPRGPHTPEGSPPPCASQPKSPVALWTSDKGLVKPSRKSTPRSKNTKAK